MQTDKENKVVSIFDHSRKTKETASKEGNKDESFDFSEVMKKNAENSGRQSRERSKSNRGVIRSYRLKH